MLLGGCWRSGDVDELEVSTTFGDAGVKPKESSFVKVSDSGIDGGERYESPRPGEGRSIVGSSGNLLGDSNDSCIGESCRVDGDFTVFHGLSNGTEVNVRLLFTLAQGLLDEPMVDV